MALYNKKLKIIKKKKKWSDLATGWQKKKKNDEF